MTGAARRYHNRPLQPGDEVGTWSREALLSGKLLIECSSLPCRSVLSFRWEAREASGSETPRVDNVARWCGGVAARSASAADGEAADHWVLGCEYIFRPESMDRRF